MLPRERRLTRNADVRAVLRRGRRRASDHVVVHVLDRGDDAPGRMTAVASRRVGNAVERNRAKRVVRAAVADVGLARGVDVAVVARQRAVDAASTVIAAELRAAWPSGIGALAVVGS